jgi:3'-5' exoribonuclease
MAEAFATPARPPRSVEQMEADLRELISTVQNPELQRLLSLMFGPGSETWAAFREAPAAKHYHQAYRHGLLEHSLTVAQAVGAIAATFPGIDRDLAVTGALLHDIGKLEAYEIAADGVIEMSADGRLHGEIPLGYYRIRRAIEALDGFTPGLEQALLHVILSHHGSLRHGSPVVPCTREATLVHMIDNLGSKLGSFDRVERGLADGEEWSGYDKGIGAGAFFARLEAAVERAGVARGERRGGAIKLRGHDGQGHREADPPAVADLLPDGGAAAGHRSGDPPRCRGVLGDERGCLRAALLRRPLRAG